MIVNGKPLPRVTLKRTEGLLWWLDIDGVPVPNVASLDYTAGGPGIGFPVVTFRIIAELNIEGAPAESATDIAPWRDAALSEEEE